MVALLVVDAQTGLVEKPLFNKQAFIETINNAIKDFRLQSKAIVFIQHISNQLVENSMSWEIAKDIDYKTSDISIRKRHCNAFEKTELRGLLKGKGIDEVVVCGLVSHGCIRATCLGAIEEGLKVKLLHKGHSCWSPDAEERIEKVEKELKGKGIEII